MKKLITLAALVFGLAAYGQGPIIKQQFGTTNGPTALTNIIKALATNVVSQNASGAATTSGAIITNGVIKANAINPTAQTVIQNADASINLQLDGDTSPGFLINGGDLRVFGGSFIGSGSTLTSLNASQLSSGTVPAARITVASALTVPSITITGASPGTLILSNAAGTDFVAMLGTNTAFKTNVTVTAGTRTWTHDSTHTVITNTATLTSSEWTAGTQKEWYNGTATITVDKTNGNILASGQVSAAGITNTGVGATKVVVTDINGKETAATLSGLTLSGTTLTASGTTTVIQTNAVNLATSVTTLNLTNFAVAPTASGATVTIDGGNGGTFTGNGSGLTNYPTYLFGAISANITTTSTNYFTLVGANNSTSVNNSTNYGFSFGKNMVVTYLNIHIANPPGSGTNITYSIITNGTASSIGLVLTGNGTTQNATATFSPGILIPSGTLMTFSLISTSALATEVHTWAFGN